MKSEETPPRYPGRTGWGDRLLFAAVGILVGFAGTYLVRERSILGPGASAAPRDPHAGLNLGPGATRDMPEAGGAGGSPPGAAVSADPAARQKLQELQQAVSREPQNYELLVQLGNAAYDADDARLAVDSYERALRIRGGDPNVLTDLGVSYRNLGDVSRALECFDRALKANPAHWQALFNEIIVYGIDRGDTARARELIARLKQVNPNVPLLDRLEATIDERAKGGR